MHHTSLGEPGFVRETLKNVTVPEGRDVLLSCTVKNLDSHKVRAFLSFYITEQFICDIFIISIVLYRDNVDLYLSAGYIIHTTLMVQICVQKF